MELELQQLTTEVHRITTEMGDLLRKERQNFSREGVVEKHMHDCISCVDKESERLLVGRLSALLPEAGFITEGGSGVHRGETYCWVIDPLDGAANCIHDNAPYCVSVALRSRTELLSGVIYEVYRDECFYAWKGGRAQMNGDELHVSKIENVEETSVITELSYGHRQYKRTAEYLLKQLYGAVRGIRMNDPVASTLCYVAAGHFNAWTEAFIGKRDYSAAAVIVLGAGGKVIDLYGSEHFVGRRHIITTNGPLHPVSQQLLREVPPLDMQFRALIKQKNASWIPGPILSGLFCFRVVAQSMVRHRQEGRNICVPIAI